MAGFEPAAPWSQTRRSIQAELHSGLPSCYRTIDDEGNYLSIWHTNLRGPSVRPPTSVLVLARQLFQGSRQPCPGRRVTHRQPAREIHRDLLIGTIPLRRAGLEPATCLA